jgi:HSP20 family protein
MLAQSGVPCQRNADEKARWMDLTDASGRVKTCGVAASRAAHRPPRGAHRTSLDGPETCVLEVIGVATRIDPFRDVDRLFDQVMGNVRNSALMPLDLFRTSDHYILQFDIPGADPGSIDVQAQDRILTVTAHRSSHEGSDVQWLAHERPTGTYARQLSLGRDADLERIEATFADGVLTLSIPVAAEAKPRKVEVMHRSSGQDGAPQSALTSETTS